MANAALVQSDGNFKIVVLQDARGEMPAISTRADCLAGYRRERRAAALREPRTLMELLDSFMAQIGSARAWNAGNMILIRGTAAQRRSLVDVVLNFDVDTMKTQTSSMATLENGRAEDIATQVTKRLRAGQRQCRDATRSRSFPCRASTA